MAAPRDGSPGDGAAAAYTRRERRVAWLLFALLLASYAYFFPRWGDWNQDSRLSLAMAIVDRGTLYIDGYPENLLPTGDYAVYNGHEYSTKPPGPALLGVPIYGVTRLVADRAMAVLPASMVQRAGALAGDDAQADADLLMAKVRAALALYAVTFCLVMVPSAAMGAAIYRLLGDLVPARGPRIWAVLGYGLASNALAYSGAFYSHQMVAYMTFFAFCLARRMRRQPGRPGLALAVGGLLGYAVISEHPSALIAAGVAVYLLWGRHDWRTVAALLVGGLLPGLLWMGYNQAVYGAPIAFGYEYEPLFEDVNTTGFFSLVYPYPEALWGITFGTYPGCSSSRRCCCWPCPALCCCPAARLARRILALPVGAGQLYPVQRLLGDVAGWLWCGPALPGAHAALPDAAAGPLPGALGAPPGPAYRRRGAHGLVAADGVDRDHQRAALSRLYPESTVQLFPATLAARGYRS
jgi:hypothetical protein